VTRELRSDPSRDQGRRFRLRPGLGRDAQGLFLPGLSRSYHVCQPCSDPV